MHSYLAYVFRHSRLLASIIAIASLIACIGLIFLTITSDTRVFFASDNENLLQLEAFERTYNQNNNVLFVVAARSGTMMTAENLEALTDLTRATWQLPHSTRVDSLTNFPHIQTIDDEFLIGDLVANGGNLTDADLERIKTVALEDLQLAGRLISGDLTTAGVNVNFKLPDEGSDTINTINAAAIVLAEDFAASHPSLEVQITGNVVLMQAFSLAALNDIKLLFPLCVFIILLVLVATLRSFKETMALAIVFVLAAAIATSVLGWLGHPLNIATVAAPVIIMTLAMASSIHVVMAVHRHMRGGAPQTQAIIEGLNDNIHPITMTSLTTAIGFLSLNFAAAPPFHVLGNLVITGIVLNFIFTFTLLPLILNKIPLRIKESSPPLERSRIAKTIEANKTLAMIVGPVLIVTSALGIFQITLDDDFIRYFDDSFSYRRASDFTEARLTGLNLIEFDLNSGKADGIFEPEYQRTVAAFTTWLRAQEKVASATAITDYTQKLHTNLDPQDAAIRKIPENRAQIAQYYLLLDLGLPEGRSMSDVISTDQSSSRVSTILRDATSGDVREMNKRASKWLRENSDGLETTGISINVLFAHLSINNIRSMISGTIYSFIPISIVITILLRSWILGAISLLANSIPAVIGFGLWGMLVGTVNLGASVLVAMTLGIVVDDTIHFLVAYKAGKLKGLPPNEAAAGALQTVGPAMLITTIALISGFSILTLSGFDVINTLGAFTAIIIAVALVVDLLLLPAALAVFDRQSR